VKGARHAPRTWILALAIVLGAGLAARPAHADEIQRLGKLLASSSAKTRLAAVTNLARLEDKRALKPLVTALADPTPAVRSMAADALGSLRHKAALPALRAAATDDLDPDVRKRAKAATIQVAKANQLPNPYAAEEAAAAQARATEPKRSRKGGRAGFGNQPRVLEAASADLCVLINSSADDSPGKSDKTARKLHADIIRQTLTDKIKGDPLVIMAAAQAKKQGIPSRQLDLSVTKLAVQTAGNFVEIEAQLRLAISDEQGKMLSFVSGGAKVQVPKKTFNARYLPTLRREALENAMRGMFDKLMIQLRDRSQS
jgi:hypothetical protein